MSIHTHYLDGIPRARYSNTHIYRAICDLLHDDNEDDDDEQGARRHISIRAAYTLNPFCGGFE